MDVVWRALLRLVAPMVCRSAEAAAGAAALAAKDASEDPEFYAGRAYEIRVRLRRLGESGPAEQAMGGPDPSSDAEAVFVFTADLLQGIWEAVLDWAVRKTEPAFREAHLREGYGE